MKQKIFIIFISFIILFLMSLFYQLSFAKYVFTNSFTVTKIQVNKKPTIEVTNISNTNKTYPQYANSKKVISLRVKVSESNISVNNFNRNHIQIFVNNIQISPSIIVSLVYSNNNELFYDIVLTKLTGNGVLNVVFPEGIIEDSFGAINEYQNFNTGIIIDNIAPSSTCKESTIENDKSKYVITANEGLRPIDGWNCLNTYSLYKIFCSPVKYPLIITDYAGNTSECLVNIENAKNIMLYYASHNTGSYISKLDNCGQISGKETIINSTSQKTERILTYLDGSLDSSVLQARIFDYTYWGENSTALCNSSEIRYMYGYSPSNTTWYDINSSNVVGFLGKKVLQLGGFGHNQAGNTCREQSNPIPEEMASQNLYGISGISLQLKNCDDYSIVYQIYVPSIGWLTTSSDGEETTYSHNKPFSAIRINIIPKSEKQYLINYWNSIAYTNNLQ